MKRFLSLLFTLALLVAAAFVGSWLSHQSGWVGFDLADWHIELKLAAALVVLALGFIVLFLLLELVFGVLRIPSRMRDKRALKHARQSITLVAQSLCALAEKDISSADRLSSRLQASAKKLEELRPLAHIVSARAAELSGDKREALAHYQQLSAYEVTKPLALTGLYHQSRQIGDTQAMVEYAEERYSTHNTAEATIALLESYEKMQDWDAVMDVLKHDAGRFFGARQLSADMVRKWRVKAHLALADKASNGGKNPNQIALSHAQKAQKEAPRNVEAAVMLMTLQAGMGQSHAAKATLKNLWRLAPEYSLYRKMVTLLALDEKQQQKLVKGLVAQAPVHVETQLVQADAALANHQPEKARNFINAVKAKEDHPDADALMDQLNAVPPSSLSSASA